MSHPRESDFNIFRSRRSKATPMKTLIAQEMSAEATPMKTLIAQEMDSPNLVDERLQKSPMDERKMNLIRKMFNEAKRMSKDEKLRRSKQFHDALHVLSSAKKLFLKGQNSKDIYSQTNPITVLRPSKVTSNDSVGERYRDEQQIKRSILLGLNKPEKSHPLISPNPSSQPTQIVVLKPNHRKQKNIGDDEDGEYQEATKEIMPLPYMHEKLGMHRREETLSSSSVFSSGYIGDESSFNKSVFSSGYVGDESSFNKSETEFMSPVSRRHWDYPDRLSSPYSPSFHTRAYYSPRSSVWRKAKKRLSKGLETMTSSGSYQGQILSQRSSSGLSDMNSDARLDSELEGEEKNMDYSPRTLMRSKSLPVSSTEFGTRLNVGISVLDLDKKKPGFSKDTKEKSGDSSVRGRVPSLIYSRNKTPGENMSFASDETHSFHGETCDEKGSDCDSPGLLETNRIDEQGMMSPESGLIASEDAWGNHDQPSLVSVLDTLLEENEQHGIERSPNSIGSNLIDRSPPIESASQRSTGILTAPKTDGEQEWFFFVKALLSVSGLQGEAQPNSFFSRWHSPESPLDTSLRVSCIDGLSDEQLGKILSQNLMFDCVNEVLINIAGYELESVLRVTGADSSLLGEVWEQMKVHFSSQGECSSLGDSDEMAERLVRREVIGKGWDSCFRSETDDWRIEIGEILEEELVMEMVVELTGRNTDCNAVSF